MTADKRESVAYSEGASVGFSQSHSPSVLPAEALDEMLSDPVVSEV